MDNSPSDSDEYNSLSPPEHGSDHEGDYESDDVPNGSGRPLPPYEYENAPLLPAEQDFSTHGFKTAMYTGFQDLAQPRVFHLHECLASFADPGLYIEGLGPVPLPLYEYYIAQIIKSRGQLEAKDSHSGYDGTANT